MPDLDAATTAAERAMDGELPDIEGLTADMRHSLVEILADAAVAAARPLIEAEAAARERQRIRQLAIDYWHNTQHTREGYVPGWFALIMNGDEDG